MSWMLVTENINSFKEIIDANSSFVARLQKNVAYDIIEQRPLTDDDKKAGVQGDIIVRLGCKDKQNNLTQPVRIVEVSHNGNSSRPETSNKTTVSSYTLLLGTDRMDLSAEIISHIYHYIWQIKLFSRWFKCILGLYPLDLWGYLFKYIVPLYSQLWSLSAASGECIYSSILCPYSKHINYSLGLVVSLINAPLSCANEEELIQHIQKLKQLDSS
jgi:hypothetical protein